jgi:beta-glucanase (GH16 family)
MTPPPGGPWTLAFHDEFDGSSLDTTKWDVKYPRPGDQAYSNVGNGEAQWYQAQNLVVRDGLLSMVAQKQDVTSPISGQLFHYTSGMIQSKPSFNFRYGYMEAKMWVPKGSGFWPAFWTWPQNEQWPPEIDVMEFYGDNPTKVYCTFHGPNGADGTSVDKPDWTTGWHVFAVDWEPNRIEWLIDGVSIKTINTSASLNMYLIANLAIADGSGAPAPDASTRFPSSLEVDYIRVWQH